MHWVLSSMDRLSVELEVINSNPAYNLLANGKQKRTEEDLAADLKQAAEVGAERYVIEAEGQAIGILEWISENPSDKYAWLGFFMIKGDVQGQHYGERLLAQFEANLSERTIRAYRLGVLPGNAPAIAFWCKQGFRKVGANRNHENQEIDIYEKQLSC